MLKMLKQWAAWKKENKKAYLTLVIGAITTGLMAGFFYGWTIGRFW